MGGRERRRVCVWGGEPTPSFQCKKSSELIVVLDEKNPHISNTLPPEIYEHTHMLKHVGAWCWKTRGRCERTHGGVLNPHTGFFSVSHTTHHTTPHHNNTTTTPHKDRDRERQGNKTETERRGDERDEKESAHPKRSGRNSDQAGREQWCAHDGHVDLP